MTVISGSTALELQLVMKGLSRMIKKQFNTSVGSKIRYLFRTRKNKNICIWILDDTTEYSPYNENFFLEEWEHKDFKELRESKLMERELNSFEEGTKDGVKCIWLRVHGINKEDLEVIE